MNGIERNQSIPWKAKGTWLSLQSSQQCHMPFTSTWRTFNVGWAGKTTEIPSTVTWWQPQRRIADRFTTLFRAFTDTAAGIVGESFRGKWKKIKNSVRRSAPRGSQSSSFRDLCGDEKRDFSTFYFSQERDFRNSSTIPCRTESEIWTEMCSQDVKWSRDLVFNSLRTWFRWCDHSATSPTGGTCGSQMF